MKKARKNQREIITKKINELDRSFGKSAQIIFAYLSAILQLLEDKGITDKKQFKKYLDSYKKQFSKLADDAEFLKLMRNFKPESGEKVEGS